MFIFTNKGHEEQCPICNFKMSDFLVHQRLGCSFCYLFLRKGMKNLISAVQDQKTQHVGKVARSTSNLLKQFFDYVIEKEILSGESDKEDCIKLKKILSDYF